MDGQQSASGIVPYKRDLPPTHYSVKIESFSLLQNSGIESFESREFEACGFQWKLNVYPNGNKKRDVNGHISLYLAISDVAKLPQGCEINAHFKFFVFDHMRDKFLTLQDANGESKRFHRMRTEWGFDKFLSLDTLKDASHGYLLDDCCVFGVEVFVIRNYGFGERFLTLKDPPNNTFTWKIENFLSKDKEGLNSDEFEVGDFKWWIRCRPNGFGVGKGTSMSLYLELVGSKTVPLKVKMYVDFLFRLMDQVSGKNVERSAKKWFLPTGSADWGFPKFMDLAELNWTSNGYLVNDTVIVEAKIRLISSSIGY